jgi:hypothetical protein
VISAAEVPTEHRVRAANSTAALGFTAYCPAAVISAAEVVDHPYLVSISRMAICVAVSSSTLS